MRWLGHFWAVAVWGILCLAQAPSLLWKITEPSFIDMVFLDDWERLLVVTGEGLELWSIKEGRREQRPRPGISCLGSNAGRAVIALGVEGGIELWDPVLLVPTQVLTHPMAASSPSLVSVSPSGRHVAGLFGGVIVVWRVPPGEPLAVQRTSDLVGPGLDLAGIAFLSEFELILVGYPDLLLWDFAEQKVRKLGTMAFRTDKVAVDPRRRWVAFPAKNALVVMCADTRETLAEFPEVSQSYAWMAFTRDGRLLGPTRTAHGLGLHLLQVGDAPKAQCCFTCVGPQFIPQKGSLSPDGTVLAVADQSSPAATSVVIYRLDGCRKISTLGSWPKPTSDVLVSKDGRYALRLSERIEIWDLPQMRLFKTLELTAPWSAALSPVGPVAAVSTLYGSEIVVWNWATGAKSVFSLRRPEPAEAFGNRAGRFTFTPDGAKLVIVHWNGDVSVLDLASGRTEWRAKDREEGGWPIITEDGRLLIVVARSGIRVRELKSGRLLDERPRGFTPYGLFLIDAGTLLINGVGAGPGIRYEIAGHQLVVPQSWHLMRFDSSGRILEIKHLNAPPELGGPLRGGRTLLIMERLPYPFVPAQGAFLLWDIPEDKAIHRWPMDLVPTRDAVPSGRVAPIPGTRKAIVWSPMSSLRLYSFNVPPMDLEVQLPVAVVGEQLRLCAKARDPEGGPLRYYWDLGDGRMAEGECVTNAYAREGSYTVRVLALDDENDAITWEGNLLVVKIRADFVWSPRDPGVLEELKFWDNSIPPGEVVRVTWDFGDGSGAQGRRVTHRYSQPGTYTVRATVVFTDGREQRVEKSIVVADVSCVEITPAPGAPKFYRIRLAPPDRGRVHFGDTLWIVRRVDEKWVIIAKATVIMPQVDGAWVVLAEHLTDLETMVGDRALLRKPTE